MSNIFKDLVYLQSEYRYVVRREPSGSIRNRVFANLRDAKEYGSTLE